MSYLKPSNAGLYQINALNVNDLYIEGIPFQQYLDGITSGLTEAETIEVKSLLEYLDITGLNTAWTVANNNVNETLRSAITALQTKTANLDTTGLTSPSVLTDANKNSALLTAIGTLITDLTALAVRVTTEEGNVDALQLKTANLTTTGLTSESVLNDANKNSVLKTALDALANTPGDVTALAGRVTTAEADIDALEGRATSLEGRATAVEGRATAVEGRATTLEGKTRFTTVSNTYFDNNIGTAQPFGIPFGDYDGSTYPIGSFKMEVGPTLASGQGKSYFEMTHKNLVQNPNFPAGDVAQASFSHLLRCAGIRSYYRKGATPGIYNLSNETFLQHTDENGDGRITLKAKVMRILPPDTNSVVEMGRFGETWSNPDIRIGGRGNQVNIGSMEDDELAQGVGDVATKTRIYIGRRPTTGNAGDVLNSQLILRGDCFTGNLNFKDLAVTSPLSIETLISFLSPSGLPAFIFNNLFGGGVAIPKSDVVVMKGTVSKRGDIETSNNLSIEKMSIINTSVGNLTPGFTLFFAQHDVTSTQLIGNNRTGVFQGEISLKNYNVVSTGVDFAFAEENDKVNVLSIKGNSGILLHQGASSNNESLDIFNSKSGPIRLFIGADGTRAGTTHGGAYIMRYLEPFGNNLVATGETKVILGSKIGIDSSLASEANQGDGFGQGKVATDGHLVIEVSTKVDTLRRQGVNVRHKTIVNNLPVYTQSIINSDSISTPSVETESLKITANYGGSATNRLYKDANNKLYWNGEQISAVNYPATAPVNSNISNTYIDNSFNLYGNSDAGFPKQSALPTALYTGTPIRTAATEAQLISAITAAGDYDVIRITANITLTASITIAKKLKIEGTSNAIVVTFDTAVTIITITSSEVWFSALTFNNVNTGSSAVILTFSNVNAIKNFVTGCIFQTNEFAISSNNNTIQITNNTFQFVGGSADSHRYIILSGCLGSCFINDNIFVGNGGASTQCVNLNNGAAAAFLNSKIIISRNVSQTNPVQRLLMVDISLAASNISFYVSKNVMQTTSGFVLLYVLPFDGIKEFHIIQNIETLGSGITGGKGIIGIDSAANSVIAFNTIVYSSGNVPAVLRTDYTNLVTAAANQNGAIAYATARFTPGATTYNVIVPLLINLDLVTPETQNLGAVMALGNTASTTLNMNNNGITNVASIQDWNVKQITAGTGISSTSAAGNYTIANTAPVQNVVAGSGGISIDYNGTTATINHVGVGGGGGGSSQTIHDLNALEEVGALGQRPTWATNWAITDSAVNAHFDMYCSVDGKVIASASPATTIGNGPIRYSTNYGSTWSNGNTSVPWRSITGTSSGSKLFATASATPYLLYTSTTQGATWTSQSMTSVTNSSPAPILNRIRASGDGLHLIMCDEATLPTLGSRIFVSANGGNSWTAKYLSTNAYGYSTNCAMSRSGRYQYAIFYQAGYTAINRSDDFGVTWTPMYNDSAIYPIDTGYFNKIECDSTGRYVYATRVHTSNATTTIPMYQSADFGTTWSASTLAISMADVWVSGTGQFVAGISVPLGGLTGSRFYYSIDYGRTYSNVFISLLSIRCVVGSGDGSTLAVGSINNTDFGVGGDGNIRVARQIPLEIVTTGLNESAMINGIMNITPNEQLWARGEGYQDGANGNYFCSFNNAARIYLSEYNIGYKVEFYWAAGTTYANQFNHLGINNYTAAQAGYNQGSNGGYTATTNMEFLHTPSSVDNKASFIGRSYCGFQQNISSTGLQYRFASILTGRLSMNNRPESSPSYGGLPASGGTLTTNDWGVFSKVLKNEFLCDNYSIVSANSNYQYDWGIYAPASIDYPFSYVTVRGNSVWDMTYGGIYYAGGADSIQNGVWRLFIRNADNTAVFGGIDGTPTNRPRNAYMKYQIYRIRK